MSRSLACAALLLVAGALSVPFSARVLAQENAQQPSSARSERLERIRTEIEARELRAREYREQAEGYLGELDAIDRELSALRSSLRRLRSGQRQAETELREARRGLQGAERELDRVEEQLEKRLVALYKQGGAGGLGALYGAADFQSLVRRSELLGRILAADGQLFALHREAQARWQESRARNERLVSELRTARQEAARREEGVRQRLVERRNLVDLLRSRSEREARAAAELREAARRLEEALEHMPAGFPPSRGSGLVLGSTPAPVSGSVRLGFGRQVDPEFGTETLRNGIEIAAAAGSQVRAVGAGRVLFSGWFRGYGQIVIVDHGLETLSVSGFLDEIGVDAGDEVRTGDAIGTVGETGSLSGPGLYFEIRAQGQPVDPLAYLTDQTGFEHSEATVEGTP